MKKFLAGIAAAAIITVPMTSFALESMSKGALKKATGQAGVSIALDNIVIYQKSAPTTTYWDMDGTSSIQGTMGQNDMTGLRIAYAAGSEKLITVGAILDNTEYGTDKINRTFGFATYAPNGGAMVADSETAEFDTIGIADSDATGYDISTGRKLASGTGQAGDTTADIDGKSATNAFTNKISPLTIDVGTCQSLTDGLSYNRGVGTTGGPTSVLDVAGVVIGLPTVEINTYHTNDTKIISIASTSPTVTANAGYVPNVSNEMIRIQKSGHSTMAILGGRLEIAPH